MKSRLSMMLMSIMWLVACTETSLDAEPSYESVVKDDAFRATIDLPPGAAFVELDKGFTYYEAANLDTCDDPTVLVHGFSVPSYIWRPTFEFLSDAGACVVMLDLYGRGFSDNPNVAYTDHLFANQVLQLLDYLSLETATLIGLSNGGRVVSQVVGLAPERVEQLIYVASSGFWDATRAEDVEVTAEEIDTLIASYPELPAGQLSDFKYPDRFPDWDDRYAELLVHKGFARALISTRKNHDSTELDRIHSWLESADIPVTTIWGDSDSVVVFDEFADKLERLLPKRNEYFVYESGHLPHLENPGEFQAILKSTLPVLSM